MIDMLAPGSILHLQEDRGHRRTFTWKLAVNMAMLFTSIAAKIMFKL